MAYVSPLASYVTQPPKKPVPTASTLGQSATQTTADAPSFGPTTNPVPTGTLPGGSSPEWINIGKWTVPNPFNRSPRINFGPMENLINRLMGQQVDPRTLYRSMAVPALAEARSNAEATAGDVARMGLGPGFAAEYGLRQGLDTASLLGQLAGKASTDATTTNAGILSQSGQLGLGLGNLALGQNSLDQSQNQALINAILSLYADAT